jgi:cytochrome bd-type quinol oxidase subunit 2
MYTTLLAIHSLVRWLVLPSLLFAIYRAFRGWSSGKSFTTVDETVRLTTVTITNIQVSLGLVLYAISPITAYFSHHFQVAVHVGVMRFFGLEHAFMMIMATLLISTGSVKVKNKSTDREKFRTMTIWFTLGLLVILIAIPWPFSPLAKRPFFRLFY